MSFPPDGHGLIYFPAETPFGKYAVFFLHREMFGRAQEMSPPPES